MRMSRKIALLSTTLSVFMLAQPHGAMAQAAAPAPATAAPAAAAAVKIAVLDDQKILQTSAAAKSIDAQLKDRRDGIEKQLADLRKKLDSAKHKLETDKDKVKPEEFSKEVTSYQNDYMSAQKFADSKRQELELAANTALGQMRAAITKIVTDMAQKNGYTLVLTRQNVVLADASMDITDTVLAQLDKTLTTVPVTFGDAAKKPAAK